MDKRIWVIALFLILFLVSSVGAFSGSGSGTSGSPFIITTAAQLDEIHDAWIGGSTYYKLGNDIDYIGYNWVPLESSASNPNFFQLNGDGHTISNFNIYGSFSNGANHNAGFIGKMTGDRSSPTVKSPAIFTKLIFKNASVINTYNAATQPEALLMASYMAPGTSGKYIASEVFVYDSKVQAASTSDTSIGVFSGGVNGFSIINCGIYNTTVTGGSAPDRGQFVGRFSTPSEMSYSWSNISTYAMMGYGGSSDGTVSASYWDDAFGSDGYGGDAKTTAEMKDVDTYSGWDFSTKWKMSSGTGHFAGYPILYIMTDYSDVTAPEASFTVDGYTPIYWGIYPVTLHFVDTSTNTPTSWLWDFDDGDTTNNTMQNPYHTFNSEGDFFVTLTATNSAGSDESTDFQVSTGDLPSGNFMKNTSFGASPLYVGFNTTGMDMGRTEETLAYYWVFGDGNTSTLATPTNIYTTGVYHPNVTIYNDFGSFTSSTQEITVGDLPTASFTKDKTSGGAPLTVTFDGTYTGEAPLTYLWVFGDGSTTNNSVADPIHTFTGVGTYNINVTVSDVYGSYTTATQSVSVGVVPVASFTKSGTYITSWLYLTDTSTGSPSSWLWTFKKVSSGAITTNTSQNPAYVCALYGEYKVNLTATSAFGSSTTADDTFYCGAVAATNWNWVPSSPQGTGTQVYLTDANTQFPPYTYGWDAQAPNGTYFYNFSTTNPSANITLDVPGAWKFRQDTCNNYGCHQSTWDTYTVYTQILANFTASNVTPIEEQTITFTDSSLGSPTAWNWSFGDGQYSSLQNPTHAYSGYSITYFKLFNVTLNITKAGAPNSTLTRTNYINVSQIPPTILPYTVNKTSGTGYAPPGLPVAFGNQYDYGYADAFDWYFDGVHSTNPNPVATFNTPGIKRVNYSATNEAGRSAWYNSTYSVLGYSPVVSGITIAPSAGFHYAPTVATIYVIETRQYSDQPVTYTWHYDDGTPDVTVVSSNTYWTSPQEVWGNHTFTAVGVYNVTVNASNAWGFDNSQFNVYTISAPATFAAPLKWVNSVGSTITTSRKNEPVSFVFDTNDTGLTGIYRYDRFYLDVLRLDLAGTWIPASEVTSYQVQSSGSLLPLTTALINTAMPTGTRWNGYTTFTPLTAGNYRGQVRAVNTTSATLYPSSYLISDIVITENPLQVSNVGAVADDWGGSALKIILGVIIIIILMVVPFLITREFNTYIEVFMVALGIGMGYFLGLIDLWVVVGVGIIASDYHFLYEQGWRRRRGRLVWW